MEEDVTTITMDEDECIKLLDDLQQYVPHLEKLIAQLKDPKQRNRELQLNKLEGLHSMITDRKKKLKLDTTKKCEDVILRILHKVHPTIFKQLQPKPEPCSSINMIKFVCKDPPEEHNKISLGETGEFVNLQKLNTARACLSEVAITPASPSPPRDTPSVNAPLAPIVIPTEMILKLALNPNEFHSKKWDVETRANLSRPYIESYETEKPNVYISVAESLSSSSSKIIFDRLGTKVDMPKPPLSAQDLQQLTAPKRENLLDLRTKLTRENPNKMRDREHKAHSTIKPVLPPPRDEEQKVQLLTKSLTMSPPLSSFKSKSLRVEKIYKNPDSKFDNLLSSIDEQILGDNQMIHGSDQMGHVDNQMVHQKELIAIQNKFIPPQQNLMHQNIPASHGRNIYMNTFILQNTVSSKMQSVNFYSPQFNQNKQPLLSPPNYANRPSFASRDQQPYMGRPKFDHWPQDNKGQWHQERSHALETEEICRQSVSRVEKPKPQVQEFQPEPVKEVVKEDPTVFKPNTKYAHENFELDKQKHEKMREINKTIISKKKFTFNLLDKIKSRLDDRHMETVAKEIENNDSSMQLNSSVDATISSSKNSIVQESFDSKKVKSVAKCNMESNLEKPIVNKTSVPISNIIEGLLGKLNVDVTQPPPLIPLNEFKIKIEPEQEEVIARVGPVGVTKKNMPKNDFEADEQTATIESSESQSEVKYLRMRSGNKLLENRLDGSKSTDSAILSNDESFCKIVNVESHQEEVLKSSHSFPFHIANVTTLTPEEKQALNAPEITPPAVAVEKVLPPLTVINTVAGSGDITTVSSCTTSPTAIPFPLQGTSGSLYDFVVPLMPPVEKSSPSLLVPVKPSAPVPTSKLASPVKAASLVKAKGPSKSIMLKEIPLKLLDFLVARKTRYAMTSLLSEQKLMHLYKCPERNCTFSTDLKKQFEAHICQHTEFNSGMQIPCLYCDFKIDFDYIGVHYDIRHGLCQYCCAYCFYRGVVQSYVEMHQEREHAKSPRRVLMVPINPDALKSLAHLPLPPLKNVIPLYECGQLGCSKKFIFADDFGSHLRSKHITPLLCFCCQFKTTTSSALIGHMEDHNICYYHCRYCMLGATMKRIYKHLSHQHSAMPPRIVFRRFWPNKSVQRQLDFAMDSPELMEHMKLCSVEDHKYVTHSARLEITPATTSKKLTLTKNPIATSVSPKAAPHRNEKGPVTPYKGRKSRTLFRIIEQPQPNTSDISITDQEKTEKASQDSADVEIVQVSVDETSVTSKAVYSGQALPKALVNNVRSASPIVLNKFLSSPKGLLRLTKSLPSSTARVVAEKTKIVTTAPPTIVEIKDTTDFIIVKPETKTEAEATLDEPLLDMNVTLPDKSTAEDVDPLWLELEACSTIIEENSGNTSTEHTFTEAKLDSMGNFSCSDDRAVQEFSSVSFSVENVPKKRGLMGRDLFRCGFCKCCHCGKAFKTWNSLIDHIRLHGTLRFACSLCDFKHQHQLHVQSHMKTRHSVTSVTIMPVDLKKCNYDKDEFVVRPKLKQQKSTDSSSEISSNSSSAADEANKQVRLSFGPDEIATLPLRPIFTQKIKCFSCTYQTKVPANLVRHVQFHCPGTEEPVPAIAPINPVPCLEKKKKKFDKMTNLALSSFTETRMASKVEKKEKSGLSKEEEARCKIVHNKMTKNLRENLLVLEEDDSNRKIRFKKAKRATSDQPAQHSKVRIVDHFEYEDEPHAEKLTTRKSTT